MLSQHDVSSWRGARAAGRHGFLFVILCVCLQSTSINARQLCTSPNAEGNKIFFRGIREDQVVGTDLGTLNIVGSESEISLVEDSTIWDDHIAYHDDGRRLSVVAQLDKDQGGNGRIQLQLSCQVRATGSQVPVPIEILLQDVNDNPPEFEEDTYVTNVSETVPIGTVIFNNIRAFDNDDSNWYVNYAIVPGQYSSFFRMPSEATGKIELAQPLDYERERTINFYVLGRDNHLTDGVLSDVHLTSSVLVTVNVLDGDDQNPQFDSSHYTATLLETSNINDLVQVTPSIRAFDPDVNINSDIEYSFVDDLFSSDTDYFSINPTDGTISVQRIPLLRGTRFALTVKATKLTRSDRFSTALLRIFVTAAPENPPIFSRDVYEASIVENTPQDIFVVNVHATDNDVGFEQGGSSLEDTEGAILLYSFAEGDQDASHFTINPTTGDISTATTLDFEEFRVYELIVEVTDSIETDQAIVRISVLNLNDNFPRFGEDSYFFEGHASNGYDIGSVTAIDADPDSNINYSLLDNFDGLFGIDMSSGELTFHGDEVQQKEYRLSVLASDSGDPPLHGIALVTVTFDVGPAAVTGGGGGGGVSVVVPIILGILAGVLLIIIIIMVLYIYRHIHSTNMNRFVKSSSFESQLHMNKSLSTSSNLYSSEALVFQNNNSRHLDIYNQIDAPPADGTPQQENPFVPDTSYDPNNPNNTIPSSRRVGRGVYVIDGTTESSSDQDHTAQNQMAGVNEIEYNTAITPMGTYRRTSGTGSTPYTNGSVPSSTMSVVGSSLSTFREPSRLSLKTDTPSKRGRSQNMTPPPPPPPQFTSPPLDGVSFIDSYQSDVYPTNPQNTDHHSSLSSNEPDRPGITVYY